jgi:hypothetical protein
MQTIKTKTTCGKVIYHCLGKLHNWDGPALTYRDKSGKDEYYLFGKQLTREEWDETKRDFNGIPPSKDPRYEQSMR